MIIHMKIVAQEYLYRYMKKANIKQLQELTNLIKKIKKITKIEEKLENS